jgi:hypothetical protein
VATDGIMRVLTGPWLIVKWTGVGISLTYVALLVVAIRRFGSRLSRMRSALAPMVLGNLVSFCLPWIFMKAEVTRICIVVAEAIFLYGIAVLARNLVQRDQTGFLKAGS